jgi:prepilin-type N-terminal cleavage/methylation domain-containing protein
MTSKRHCHSARRGFTLIEFMMVIVIIAMTAAVVVPQMSDDEGLRLDATAEVIQSDIELAQVMNIADPDRPIVVRFQARRNKYWLAEEAVPDTPILREDNGQPYLVTLGSGRALSAIGVDLSVADMTADTLYFNSQGGLNDFSKTPGITLALNGKAITLTVNPTTGTISRSGVGPAPEPEPKGKEIAKTK